MSGKPDPERFCNSREDRARSGWAEIVLPEVNSVSIGRKAEIEPVIDYQSSPVTSHATKLARDAEKYSRVFGFLTVLDQGCASID